MEVKAYDRKITDWKGDAIAIILREGEKCEPLGKLSGIIGELISRKDFTGKKGNFVKAPVMDGDLKNLYLMGVGKDEGKNLSSLVRSVTAELVRKIKRDNCVDLLIYIPLTASVKDKKCIFKAIGEGIELGAYSYDKYKTKEDEEENKRKLEKVSVAGAEEESLSKGIVFACSQNYARDIANEPGNTIYPQSLADKAKELALNFGLECEVWDEKRLLKEKMGCIYAVGAGSKNQPRFIHLVYRPAGVKKAKKVVIVGKGITYDSGGLDLKPSEFLRTMKGDKTGACNVLGVMRGISKLKPKVEVHGIISAAENMPGGASFRPDDILTARNGKTIEIDNTDAEGRLVLADALCYASELKPDVIIDMATLTGACAVALGPSRAGLFSNDDALAGEILSAGEACGESLWRLPAEDEKIKESLKSPVADMVNCGSRYGGATFAAIFLQEFIGEAKKGKAIPWVHLDIAGVDFFKESTSIYSKGASAFGTRICLEYIMTI
ncbi:MAG: leucyl aminopeptidase [Synergistaceae bacterium]|nr:leucyl aminopeptidase [Synergistaceae bacterium]